MSELIAALAAFVVTVLLCTGMTSHVQRGYHPTDLGGMLTECERQLSRDQRCILVAIPEGVQE